MEELTNLTKAVEEQNRLWNEFKTENDRNRGASEEKLVKINDRLDAIETKMNRTFAPAADAKSQLDAETQKAFRAWAKTGVETEAVRKTMYVSNDTTGGYLQLPGDMDNTITKNVIEFSPVRSFARVSTTSSGEPFKVPKRTSPAGAATWTSEQGTRSATGDPAYGLLEIPTHELYALIDISQRNLEDSAYNLEDELNSEFTEQFGLAEGVGFVTGNGVGKPEGITVNADVTVVGSGSAGDFDADDLIDLLYGLKDAYWAQARWMFKRPTLAKIRKLKDTSGQYVWAPAVQGADSQLAQGVPATILDKPYFFADAMAATGTDNNKSIVVGDFSRFRVVDRLGTQIQRDPYTQNTAGLVRFIARRRVGGQVVQGEAFRVLKEH